MVKRKTETAPLDGVMDAPYETAPETVWSDVPETGDATASEDIAPAATEENIGSVQPETPAEVSDALEDVQSGETTPASVSEPEPSVADGGLDGLREAIESVLKTPRSKNSLPVMSMYSGEAGFKRYFLLDIDAESYIKAWNMYYDAVGKYDPDGFLLMVYDIIQSGLPRLYRAVSWAPLERRI